MGSLVKRALDQMITQLLAKVGGEARVLGPGAPLHCRMDRYVGTLFHLLTEAFPGIPEASLAAVRRDLIVVTSAPLEKEASVVGFQPSTLRVAHTDAVSALKATYAVGLNMTIQRSKYELSDLAAPVLTLDETFFAPRSIEGWRKLTLRLARLCHALSEVTSAAKLRSSEIWHDGERNTHLIPLEVVGTRGGKDVELELQPV